MSSVATASAELLGFAVNNRETPESDANALLTWSDWYQLALDYRRWGWTCFPVDDKKRPLGRWKSLQNRKPTDRQLGRLFDYNPKVKGLAVLAGRASSWNGSGLLIRDFDTPDGYRAWADAYPDLARRCPTALTARGVHVYARNPDPDIYQKSGLPFGTGELIGDRRHFVVVPPSAHPSGSYYRWRLAPDGPDSLPVLTPRQAGFMSDAAMAATAAARSKRPHITPTAAANGSLTGDDELPLPIREAVLRAVPTGPGQRHDKLFALAQSLKDIAPGVRDPGYWSAAFGLWWRLAEPQIGTKDREQSWADFRTAVSRCTTPTSQTVAQRAIRQGVEVSHVSAEESAESRKNPKTSSVNTRQARLILDACRKLAGMSPDGVFFLSCREAAKACGLSRESGRRALKSLVAAGLLIVVCEGKPSSTRRVATRYQLGDG